MGRAHFLHTAFTYTISLAYITILTPALPQPWTMYPSDPILPILKA